MNKYYAICNKNRLLGAIPALKGGALRSSLIGDFWNKKFRAKARGFKPAKFLCNIFLNVVYYLASDTS